MIGWVSARAGLIAAAVYGGIEVVALLFGLRLLPDHILWYAVRIVGIAQSQWIGAIVEQHLVCPGKAGQNPVLPGPAMFIRGALYTIPPAIAWLGVIEPRMVLVSLLSLMILGARAVYLTRRSARSYTSRRRTL